MSLSDMARDTLIEMLGEALHANAEKEAALLIDRIRWRVFSSYKMSSLPEISSKEIQVGFDDLKKFEEHLQTWATAPYLKQKELWPFTPKEQRIIKVEIGYTTGINEYIYQDSKKYHTRRDVLMTGGIVAALWELQRIKSKWDKYNDLATEKADKTLNIADSLKMRENVKHVLKQSPNAKAEEMLKRIEDNIRAQKVIRKKISKEQRLNIDIADLLLFGGAIAGIVGGLVNHQEYNKIRDSLFIDDPERVYKKTLMSLREECEKDIDTLLKDTIVEHIKETKESRGKQQH